MKFLYFSLLIFLLFSKNIICEDKGEGLIEKETKEEKEARDNRTAEKLLEFLKSLDLENKRIITREELYSIFNTLMEIGISELNYDEKTRETYSSTGKIIADQIFNLLATKEKDIIEIDKIMEYFSPKAIKKYIDTILKLFGLEKIFESYIIPLLALLEKIFMKYNKIADL